MNSMAAIANIELASMALQPVLYSTLAHDRMLELIVKKQVFDGQATAGATLPYIVLGEIEELAADLLTQQGRQVAVTLHVFSNYRGNQEASAIASRIVQLLNHTALSVGQNWYIALALFKGCQVVPDPGEARHYVVRMEYRMHARPRF